MLHLTKKDFKVDWFSGQGAGGQHRNKKKNCCRITHTETGLVGIGQNSRSRKDNQKEAFLSLASKILNHYGFNEKQKVRKESNNVIRTYNFERNEVTDGYISSQIESILNGDLERFVINALQDNRRERKTGR